ncbi:MAG: tRNA (adenosine(37)-N6)-dimethylallyltransferase MiaA [Clostridia bacterium]
MSGKVNIAVIVGATATGKSALSVAVAQRIKNAEIVTADSAQIYRGMNIGTAKPTLNEMGGVPHHMIDVADIVETDFSVAKYKQLASSVINDIASRGKIPIVAGGTGLYINSITYPLSFQNIPPNIELREKFGAIEERNKGALHELLTHIDPERAALLHPNDIKRVIRALEIYYQSEIKPSSMDSDFVNDRGDETEFEPIIVGLTMPRVELYARINERVDKMMEAGLLDEVKGLLKAGYNSDSPAFSALGYRQLISYIEGSIDLKQAVEDIKLKTRRFAKRQETWFKRDKRISWLKADSSGIGDSLLNETCDIFSERGLFTLK